MVENSEEYMEHWWTDVFAKGEQKSQPLLEFLCINNLQGVLIDLLINYL